MAKVLKEVDAAQDIEVSYLRVRGCGKFGYPPVPDLASVGLDFVKMILPKPRFLEGSSKRQQRLYSFDVSLFEGLKMS